MADSVVNITEGSGKGVDTRTESTSGHHRQVVTLGHESATDSIAAVQATDPSPSTLGLVVRDPLGTITYSLMDGSGIRVRSIADGTVSVNTVENVTRVKNVVDGTLTTVTGVDRVRNIVDGTLSLVSTVTNITNSIAVHVLSTGGTLQVQNLTTGTVAVSAKDGTFAVYFSPGTPAVSPIGSQANTPFRTNTDGALKVYDIVTGTIATVTGVTNSIQVHLLSTNGTIGVNVGAISGRMDVGRVHNIIDGTIRVGNITASTLQVNVGTIAGTTAVYLHSTAGTVVVKLARDSAGVATDDAVFTIGTGTGVPIMGLADAASQDSVDEDDVGVLRMTLNRLLMTNIQATAGVFTVSGTTSTAGNNTLVAPSASYSFKVYAYSLQTTGIVSSAPRFTTGASAGATELWRPLINSVQTASAPIGANLAVSPPGYLFATGTSTTLSLYLDTGTLVHYSVSFIKESA